ncbi:DUF222 domain-containing protein [Actinotalea sp. Marseille-Q4924]|uniref:DUF222 domain-containing protein n=1 Tax=Actinotalea sp. Marseille-Q4924 TaxID=2866571 RepID=UPI001CE4A4B1|nr:DUF222 domain-containing protein [Actinotalea sp. Marseille-Q4924]
MFDTGLDDDAAAGSGELPPGSDLRRPWVSSYQELTDAVGPVGSLLAEVRGGPELVDSLGELEAWAWDAGSLVEVVAAYERVVSWARAGAAAAAARLADRPEMNPSWPREVGRPAEADGAPSELSLRLGVSRRAASTLVGMGQALRSVHHSTGDALAAGHLDWPRARVVVESLEHVAPVVALEVEDRVLPTAAGRTPTQLRRDIARILEEIDPEDAADRHEHARARRCVTRPRALPDGMASMTATLTVEAAVRLDACLQAAAEAARRDGDGRGVDQLRADALDAMGEVAWTAGYIGLPPSTPAGESPRGGSLPGGRATPPGGGATPPGPGQPDQAASSPFMVLGRRAGPPVRVHVTVGYGTLLGLDDRPGELAGYGPVSADVARRLAVDGTWRRLLVDEPSGTVLDVGKTRYAPPADMVELVRERNRSCVFPTCGVPARRCQTDHTEPFPREGGRPVASDGEPPPGVDGTPSPGGTAADNLGPLCATHHLFKTHGGFRLAQPRPGSFVVHTPSGHVYLQGPDRPPGVPEPPPGGTAGSSLLPSPGRSGAPRAPAPPDDVPPF